MTYELRYDGQIFVMTGEDYVRLQKVFSSGTSFTSTLFRFSPVGMDRDVEIAVGAGAGLTITRSTPVE